jgi:hypothetical protein
LVKPLTQTPRVEVMPHRVRKMSARVRAASAQIAALLVDEKRDICDPYQQLPKPISRKSSFVKNGTSEDP